MCTPLKSCTRISQRRIVRSKEHWVCVWQVWEASVHLNINSPRAEISVHLAHHSSICWMDKCHSSEVTLAGYLISPTLCFIYTTEFLLHEWQGRYNHLTRKKGEWLCLLLSIERKKEREMYVKGSYLQVMGLRKMFTFFSQKTWLTLRIWGHPQSPVNPQELFI